MATATTIGATRTNTSKAVLERPKVARASFGLLTNQFLNSLSVTIRDVKSRISFCSTLIPLSLLFSYHLTKWGPSPLLIEMIHFFSPSLQEPLEVGEGS
jgi:hypothetical protein